MCVALFFLVPNLMPEVRCYELLCAWSRRVLVSMTLSDECDVSIYIYIFMYGSCCGGALISWLVVKRCTDIRVIVRLQAHSKQHSVTVFSHEWLQSRHHRPATRIQMKTQEGQRQYLSRACSMD